MAFWSTRKTKKGKQGSGSDFPDFDDNLLDLAQQLQPEATIPTGWPLYRRGGSYRHWDTDGTNNYVPTGFTQIGIYEWNGNADYNNGLDYFPRNYSGRPLVWGSVYRVVPDHTPAKITLSGTASTIYIEWWTESNITQIKIAWLAMGPGAGI
jgi:hypothetical protein